ncbi:FG-GAP-like repeat-containing protein [Dyadobacter sp. MSC1_007]|jgi:hypothetical protein|uniref:FG-GAP-like repeat-containing protein n=1 Tax=Dyadobacter sp. MSC1_007 TaxID=2909264 RepID=UPI0020309CBC|nr:FG-GAP-like repeat-containing protein [Dyadobacter sp. MSC1_007]
MKQKLLLLSFLAWLLSLTLLTGPPAVNQSTATFQRSPPSGLLERKPQKAIDIQGLKQSTWYSTAMKNMQEGEYHFNKVANSDTYSTPNRKNNLRFYYDESGFTVQPRVTQIPVGDKDLTTPPDEIKYKTLPDWKIAFNLDKKQIGKGTWQIAGNKAEYQTDNITVQYINNMEGMRQNFIVQKPLSEEGTLKLNFSVETTLKQRLSSDRLQFVHEKRGVVLNYEQLMVWDANGKVLAAAFEKNNSSYAIQVNTADAVYPITIDPISTAAAAMIESNQANADFGYSVASAGDVNGDGYGDVIVGAPYYEGGMRDEGAAFVYHGSATGISTTAAAMVESNQIDGLMGRSVASAGDVNRDGYGDVIVGIWQLENGENSEGGFHIYHGSAAGMNTTAAAVVESNQEYAYMGYSLASAGDVNADGYSDVIVGARLFDNGEDGEGAAFIYHGSATGINTTAAAMVEGNQTFAVLGISVASAGDVNSDGYSDVIVGADLYDNGETDEGAAFVYHGSATGINTTAAAMVESNQQAAQMGFSVASAGDVDGDGYSDIIVGVFRYDNSETEEGAAFVYHGSATGINTTATAVIESNILNANMGISVAGAGDINGDGYSDIIVGANQYSNGEAEEGAAFIYHGSATGINTIATDAIESNQANAYMGYSVASAGDVNGDGYSDIIVGAMRYDNGERNEGAAFIFHGSSAGLPVDLISFKVGWQEQGKSARVNFVTENESEICCYEIEKSDNGFHFNVIGHLDAGNYPDLHMYNFIDLHASGKRQYYRLKTIHATGEIDHSRIVLLQDKTVTEILVFPNPTADVLQLQLNKAYSNVRVQVVNSAGRMVKQLTASSDANQTIKIPVGNLITGTYFLYVQTVGQTSGQEKQALQFIKQ